MTGPREPPPENDRPSSGPADGTATRLHDRGSALAAGPEFDLIRAILDNDRRLRDTAQHEASIDSAGAPGDRPVLRGPGDDCALVDAGAFAISTDVSVENVHFRRQWISPEAMGYRAAASALSDLAAAAARPIGLLAAVVVPAPEGDLAVRIMEGVSEAAARSSAVLLGGDLSEGPGIAITITVIGSIARAISRSGARVGDDLWVTGELGGAAAAVTAWKRGVDPQPGARRAFERPVPRIREAMWLADREMLDAAIDVSDGILSDAAQLAAASHVRIIIETGRLPLHADADMNLGLAGGEDYELLFAAPPSLRDAAGQFESDVGTRIMRIGEVAAGEGIRLRDEDGNEREPRAGGYTHFRGAAPAEREDGP